MSRWGLTYKGVEIVTPAEWNLIVDALNDLDTRVQGGQASFVGDGSTKIFQISHGLGTTPVSVMVGKGASGLPNISYWTADSTQITVEFETAPSSGATVKLWWLALKPPSV
jgi:hypothetical protein